MKVPVTIAISGAEGTEERTYSGVSMEKDGSLYLFYRGEAGDCRITVKPNRAEIIRRGEPLQELRIVKNEFTEAVIRQGFGSLCFQVKGRSILVRNMGEARVIELCYGLYSGESPVSENRVMIRVRPDEKNE